MSKAFKDSEKTEWTVVRVIVGICLALFFLFAWVLNPGVNSDNFSNETLWEAVHPYHGIFDTVGMIGFTLFCLYIAGLLGKAVYAFTGPKSENSAGMIHIIGIVAALLVGLMFV